MTKLPSIRQMRYLVALSEARHFRKAAEVMGISQPSLSLQIGNLEDLLGVRLVERGRGPVTLTPEGREVVTRASRILQEVRGIMDLTAALQTGLTGTIRLGTTPTIGPYLMPFVVERLHAKYPDLLLFLLQSWPYPCHSAQGKSFRIWQSDLLMTISFSILLEMQSIPD